MHVSALSRNIGLAMVLYRHLFFLVYKIDFTIVQLLSIVKRVSLKQPNILNKLVTASQKIK